MNNVKMFNHREFGELDTLINEDGSIWFDANQVAKILGYAKPNDTVRTRCKGAMKHSTLKNKGGHPLTIIPEPDLYRLVAGSQLPQAERFEVWIFEEVLPSIRKHGAYMTPETIENVLLNPDMIISLATELKKERETIVKQNQIIGELKPKADYTDTILKNKGLVTITQIAKDYGMSGREMNDLLHELKVQYKQSGQWLLYSKHQAKGYTHSDTVEIVKKDGTQDIKMNTKWTQKGRLFLYDLLKQDGVIPTIEQ